MGYIEFDTSEVQRRIPLEEMDGVVRIASDDIGLATTGDRTALIFDT